MTRNMESAIAMSVTRRQTYGGGIGVFAPHAHGCSNGGCLYAESVGQIAKRHGFAANLDVDRRPPVSILAGACRPATVFRRVRTVVVDTFDRVLSGWSRTHVGVEPLKGHGPFRADGYSSASIAREGRIRRIQTALFNAAPDVVFRQAACGSATSVSGVASSSQVSVKASATIRAFAEFLSHYFGKGAAIAKAPPNSATCRTVRALKNYQATEALSDSVDEKCHTLIMSDGGAL